MSLPAVTVVVPTFNRARDLPDTLVSLLKQRRPPAAVTLVDNGSTDGTETVIAGFEASFARAGIQLTYRRKRPEGPAAARNLGWREADTAHIAFVDSDVSLDPGWLEAACAVLATEADVGAVGGRVVYAHRPDLLNCYGGVLGPIGLAWDAHEGDNVTVADAARDVLWANCSALLVRRSALNAIGGFDDAFFYGYEDSDLGWRLNLAGRRVRVVPEAVAHHRVGHAIGPAADLIIFHAMKNRLRSVLVNWGTGGLARYGFLALGYSLIDAVLRSPRAPKFRALVWTLRHMPNTLRRRRSVQGNRRMGDDAIRALMAPTFFPARRLAGLRRRPADRQVATTREVDDRA